MSRGATTIWENWEAIRPDGKVSIFSYNHYAFGAVFNWIYRNISGIRSDAPGYKKIEIKPLIDPALDRVETSHETVYGAAQTKLQKNGNTFTLDVKIPCNATAEVVLPDGQRVQTGSGIYQYSWEA